MRIFSLLLLCCLSAHSVATDNRTLYFNRPADTPQARYVIELLQTAYQQLGYKLEVVDFNRQSALIAANNGALDGQLGRIHGVTQAYPNLLQVRFPLYTFNLQLLSRCLSCTFEQLDSLVIQSGYLVSNQYLDSAPFNGQLIEVKNNITQLNLVTQGKVQAALVVDFHLREHLADMDLETFKIDTLLTIETYHYLHIKHKALIPRLEEVLHDLAKKGTVAMLKAKYQI
ncbi:substrate-binding periplasmic protein [Pseudoalteromonas rubra]|uniref:substrate-binding periplasmic protein n=1 Tax=Pseudoalteromonas rubra TaxID=43658 RepID=UPI000F7B696C|nr:transporter substrate-binding domain-containing protein [Pseudoalteromonas rubra]